MTSQIRSHIEYVILPDNILVLLLHSNIALLTSFQYDLMIIQKWLTYSATLYVPTPPVWVEANISQSHSQWNNNSDYHRFSISVPPKWCTCLYTAKKRNGHGMVSFPTILHFAIPIFINYTYCKPTVLPATRCQILRLKCTKFHFGWAPRQTPLGSLQRTSRPDSWISVVYF